ncbi:DNA-binding LacI/PurR family transcriptional regulator [Lactobacillus colini]|uniref:DNA-binding LacI/PurR family transcriptional regulator n=1 Tax=Lactobacillus colini TaxID=1819254 RepID=A0ABS4MFL3_9LACO|nr:LacI family DNA-binding transcriptional regulator [Lactobacillus colini]MBP2058476.1 DNA-binding LacI/PurR family transcriptional regulator [Lactobacillus colini]
MATIKQVAKEAGVGTTTVSRYLNNQPYVSDDIKDRIKAAIKKLDYTPNRVAKQFRTNQTKQIGVLVSRITNPFFAYLFDKIEREFHKYGYTAMIMQTYDDPEIEKYFLNMIDSHEVDGLMLASVEDDKQVMEMFHKYPKSIVLVNEYIPELKDVSIRLDHYQATLNGLKYLFDKGNKKIAYITGGKFKNNSHGNIRNRAYRQFLEDVHQQIDTDLIFENLHSSEDGEKLGEILFKADQKPDAVFTNSDEVAIGLISSLKDNGIRVPEDIAVMGYDDQPFSKYALVPLTTIAQPVNGLALNSVRLLLNNMDVQNNIKKEPLKLKIIKRQSA